MNDRGLGDGMGMAGTMRRVVALPALAASVAAFGQAAGVTAPGPMVLISSSRVAPPLSPVNGEIVREIDDPHTGARWLLLRDSSHPGGPGRLVLAVEPRPQALDEARGGARNGARSEAGQYQQGRVSMQPVIRAGERLIVEESTAVVDARLEAVALGPAAIGSPLNVKLAIGGKVVRAVALAPGRAAFQAETEVSP
jgi:hypothetical protein